MIYEPEEGCISNHDQNVNFHQLLAEVPTLQVRAVTLLLSIKYVYKKSKVLGKPPGNF
jgi:hypothetical protein